MSEAIWHFIFDLDWGTVDGWFYTVVTLGLFVVGFRAIRYDRTQIAILRWDAISRVASSVTTWPQRVRPPTRQGNPLIVDVNVHNGSPEAVYNIRIAVIIPNFVVGLIHKDVMPPLKDRPLSTPPMRPLPGRGPQPIPTPGDIIIDMRFRDGARREWQRTTPDGELRLVNDPSQEIKRRPWRSLPGR